MGGGRIVEGRSRGRRLTSVEVEWDEVENGKGSELSMKDFAIKASFSVMEERRQWKLKFS